MLLCGTENECDKTEDSHGYHSRDKKFRYHDLADL